MHARWQKKKVEYPTKAKATNAIRCPILWAEESKDEDDIFMPSEASKKAAAAVAAKGKGVASSKDMGERSSKGKSVASSKTRVLWH